ALLSSLFFLILPFAFFRLERAPWKKTLSRLGFFQKTSLLETLRVAVFCFAALFVSLLILGFAFAPFLDTGPALERIRNLSLSLLILAVTLGPLGEEVFFRGFLQPQLGVVLTSFLFGLLHSVFSSPLEGVAAFVASLILGYFYRKYANLYASILAHAVYNASSLLLVLGLGLK
ncbi:MAG TPA: CPBP family intramembrane glutamic endopeptidase, partial [Candidatus Norongarragalinales archaeon]|nr:CPBP family intramembrane glutamic endopeptidase [Candidatus Norongarragalinales archaeon]